MARERWSSRWAAGYGFRFFASPHREFVLEEVREYSDTTLNEVVFFWCVGRTWVGREGMGSGMYNYNRSIYYSVCGRLG